MRIRPIPRHDDKTPTHLFPDLEGSPPLFRFIDLFAGIGGMRLGLERPERRVDGEYLRGRCVYTVEFDRFAMQTYSANFGREHPDGSREPVEPEDIHTTDASDIGEYEVLAAGFPCQPFSIAGISKKLSLGREHGFRDEKSGNLFYEIVRLIDEAPAPPPVLFLENVKHFLRHDKGNTYEVVRKLLKQRGYNVIADVVDAQHWVPQHRERTFIIGMHRDWYGKREFQFPKPRTPRRQPVLADVLEDGPIEPRYTLTPHLWQYLQDYKAKHLAAGNGFGFGLVGPSDVTRTLSARYHKDGSEILVAQEGTRPRRLTPRECSLLMGFPDDFEIPVSDTQAYRQFGNAVVVDVVAWLAESLVDQAGFPLSGEPPYREVVTEDDDGLPVAGSLAAS